MSDVVKVARAVLDDAIARVKAAEDALDAAIALQAVAHEELRKALREADEKLPSVTVVFPGWTAAQTTRDKWVVVSRTAYTIKARPCGFGGKPKQFRRYKSGRWGLYPRTPEALEPYLENVDMEKSA